MAATSGPKAPIEAGAPDIAVTPAMIERGLLTFLSVDLEFESSRDALGRVLRSCLSGNGFIPCGE